MVVEKKDTEGKMTFISKAGASLKDYILCTYDFGRCLRTFKISDMIVRDYIIEKQ
jgi:hypothetical protein